MPTKREIMRLANPDWDESELSSIEAQFEELDKHEEEERSRAPSCPKCKRGKLLPVIEDGLECDDYDCDYEKPRPN